MDAYPAKVLRRCASGYFFFNFFHFQKKYKPTPDRIYNPMPKYIGFTTSPKKYEMIRIRVVLIFVYSINAACYIDILIKISIDKIHIIKTPNVNIIARYGT